MGKLASSISNIGKKRKAPSFTANVLYQFTAQVLSFVLEIGVYLIIARWLGPEGKGIVNTLQTFLNFYGSIALLGLPIAIKYHIACRKYTIEDIVRTFSYFVLCFFFPITFLLIILTPYLSSSLLKSVPSLLIIVSLALSLLTTYFSPLVNILTALRFFDTVFVINSVNSFLRLISISLFLILLKWGIWGACASDWSLIPLNIGLALYFLRDIFRLSFLKPRLNRTILKEMLSYGLYSFMSSVAWMVNTRFDVFIVNSYWGAGVVGLYMTGVKYTELMRIVPFSITSVLFPQVSSLTQEEARKLTSFLTRACLLYYLPIAFLLYFLAPIVIPLFFGSSFVPSISVVPYLIPGIISWIYFSLLANHLSGRGYPNYSLYSALVGSFFTLLLDFLLIPKWGIIGASVASSIAYSSTFFVNLHFFRKLEKLPLKEIFLPKRHDFIILLEKFREIREKTGERSSK